MLPTEMQCKEGDLCKLQNGSLSIYTETGRFDFAQPQHLHFTSDEDIREDESNIKEGDWKYCPAVDGWKESIQKHVYNSVIKGYKKIVASTDTSLNLPTIPEEWIRNVYIPANGKINEVELEIMETEYSQNHYAYPKDWEYELKLTEKNEVIIMNDFEEKIIHVCAAEAQEASKNEGFRVNKPSVRSLIDMANCVTEHVGFIAGQQAMVRMEQSKKYCIDFLEWLRNTNCVMYATHLWI